MRLLRFFAANKIFAAGDEGSRYGRPFSETAFGKLFTAEDYVPVLQGWKDGKPIEVSALVSAKSGAVYAAKIVLDEKSGKMKLDFGAAG